MPAELLNPADTDAPLDMGGRILIVEDDPVVSLLFREVLEESGFSVAAYPSAEVFLKADWQKDAACLLLDSGLPGMGGVELLRTIRANGSQLPVVMITGQSDVQTAVAAMKAGALDLVEKPVSTAALLALVERAVGQSSSIQKFKAWQDNANQFVASLTPRQREVLQHIVDGHANKQIAIDLSINQRTVENHRAAIMKKAGSKSLPYVARLAFAANLPDPTIPGAIPPMPIATGDGGEETQSDQFERFFDQIPLAVVVSTMAQPERIIYANPSFEQISGRTRAELEDKPWHYLQGHPVGVSDAGALADAVVGSTDFVGAFQIDRQDAAPCLVDVFSNIIADDDDKPTYRLVALVDVSARENEQREELEQKLREKDILLLEIQHRVKNNLQLITALIRIEARNAKARIGTVPFDRLAGRINSIQLVYKLLSESGGGDEVDLGVYLSEIASSVMHSYAVEGIRLDMKVDAYPVSVNVALPTGMVVNELLTNALKHAFVDRDSGVVTLHSLSDAEGCRVMIADDGVGLPPGVTWPKRGKLGELIVQSLRQNAKATLEIESQKDEGVRVTINFKRQTPAHPRDALLLPLG